MSKKLFVLTSFVLVLSLVCNAGAQGTGTIMYEIWSDIGGTNVEDLTGNANFPDNPTSGEELTLFETPTDIADNFGGRVYGWLHPATSGDYTFWIATDDSSDLLLSTDDDPANAVVIAGVDGWAPARAFDGEAGSPGTRQMSEPIALVGGQKYYIEGIYKEGGGGDNLAVAWQGPDSPDRTVIDGAFLSPAPWNVNLLKAKDPNPADGAVDADTSSLEWAAGPSAASYKVYLSTDAAIDESELVSETDLTIHLVALDIGAAYYWRVDVVEADGTVREGNVWSFTTLPLEAHFPNPADGAKSQPMDSKLSWTAGKGVIMHDLYFGTDEALVAAGDPSTFKGKVMVTSFDPGVLELETTYYWKVDEFSVTGTNAGPLWSFTTFGSVEITDPDLLLYYNFETGEGDVAIDQSGHSNHGQFMGTPEWATGYLGGGLAIERDEVDYLQTAGSLGITSNNITVAGWVKHDASPQPWSGILTTRGSGNLGLQHNGVELRYMWGADQYWDFSSGLNIPNGEWYFAALAISPDQGKLYLNGTQTATNVAEHVPVTFDSQIRVARDHNDDRVMTCLIDEVRLYNKTLTDVEILKLMGAVSDVTAPGDVVQGVPNDGDWPGAETPDLATDDNTGTKYLHFKGETEPTGFQIAPASGSSIVTGLTLTTANDATERDPISFELSGSNDSIDGPYTLIASGDIVDFAQETAISRFTMNSTAITFDNNVAYAYYQVMFPTVRDPGSANSMQIAEVELLGVPAPLARWEFEGDFEGGIPVGDVGFADDPDMGKVLSLPGGDDQYVDLGSVGISGNMPRTITVWAKADNTSIPDWTLIFGFTGDADGNGGNGSHFNIGSLGGPGGVGAHVWGWEETIFSDEEALEWHHYAMSYDGTTIQYYGDGDLLDTDLGKSNVRDLSISADRVHAGSRITQASSFPGKVDDARVYGLVLTQAQVRGVMNAPRPGAKIIWVSGFYDDNADGAPDDQEWVDILEAAGYVVDYNPGWLELDEAQVATLNAADLVIVSRNSNSGDYDDGDEVALWNSVTTPIINSSTHIVRSSRWKWVDSTTILSLTPAMVLADGTEIPGINAEVGPSSFMDTAAGNGTVLATGDGLPFIIEWEAGVEYYDGAGEIAGGPRVFFTAGTQETAPEVGRGEMNLSPEALAVFMETVDRLISPPAPAPAAAVNLLPNGGFEDGVMDPWNTYGSLVTTAEVVQVLDGAAV
ncbi:MAG: LamG-like jellyroll fold domain-containing protein, partial [Sedimentisphaerales bacterium]|nr:LamG-like jellyroll fold domain-containing protein [Sedimentisphaerales bacterium]